MTMSKAEKFIKDYTRNCSNEIIVTTQDGNSYTNGYTHWLTPDQARKAVEIAKGEIYEWLNSHNDYIAVTGSITRFDMEKCVRDLKQVMKDET